MYISWVCSCSSVSVSSLDWTVRSYLPKQGQGEKGRPQQPGIRKKKDRKSIGGPKLEIFLMLCYLSMSLLRDTQYTRDRGPSGVQGQVKCPV